MRIPSSNLERTCCVQKLFLTFRTLFVHNMFFPCSAKRRASDKDLPAPIQFLMSLQPIFIRKQQLHTYIPSLIYFHIWRVIYAYFTDLRNCKQVLNSIPHYWQVQKIIHVLRKGLLRKKDSSFTSRVPPCDDYSQFMNFADLLGRLGCNHKRGIQKL